MTDEELLSDLVDQGLKGEQVDLEALRGLASDDSLDQTNRSLAFGIIGDWLDKAGHHSEAQDAYGESFRISGDESIKRIMAISAFGAGVNKALDIMGRADLSHMDSDDRQRHWMVWLDVLKAEFDADAIRECIARIPEEDKKNEFVARQIEFCERVAQLVEDWQEELARERGTPATCTDDGHSGDGYRNRTRPEGRIDGE